LADASWSFTQASRYLGELSGLNVSPNTGRSVCQREVPRIETWQATSAASEKYRKTAGNDEFETDGTCVNTNDGWKEMRGGVFAKRMPGEPATPAEWKTRKVPSPGVRVAFAAIEDHEAFAARWPVVAARLGIRPTAPLDVWADGARWIWDRVDYHFAFARGTLDIYHALEHVSEAAKAQFGEGSQAAEHWREQASGGLLRQGWSGIKPVIDDARITAVRAPQRAALSKLSEYLRSHATRLNYAERLAAGRSAAA